LAARHLLVRLDRRPDDVRVARVRVMDAAGSGAGAVMTAVRP
jgi:hypothetical protein